MATPIINSEGHEIPEKTLLVIPNKGRKASKESIGKLLEPLAGQPKRRWFNSHFYYCLPLTIGNQYGFIVYALKDFTVRWDGGIPIESTVITCDERPDDIQNYKSHFGSGIVTVQNDWHIRTPPSVNIMTINPPNFFKRGITHMTGVVETDNLRRDFTFNLRITEPDTDILFRKGEPVGAFICIPRYFADQFTIAFGDELYTQEQLEIEEVSTEEFSRLRGTTDQDKPHQAGRLYFRGEDAWGNKFPDHQIQVKKRRNTE